MARGAKRVRASAKVREVVTRLQPALRRKSAKGRPPAEGPDPADLAVRPSLSPPPGQRAVPASSQTIL